jgi:hypothetical protein
MSRKEFVIHVIALAVFFLLAVLALRWLAGVGY